MRVRPSRRCQVSCSACDKQRQGAGLALDLAYQQVDQTGLQQQADLAGRSLDRRPQVGFAHRAQQVQAGLDEAGEVRVGGQLAETVGAQGDDQRATLGMGGEGGEERGLFGRILAEGDGFLALVDHEHRHRTRRRKQR